MFQNTRKNQPKFRPSLTIADMLDCTNALQAFNPNAPAISVLRTFIAKLAVTNPELFPSAVGTKLNSAAFAKDNNVLAEVLNAATAPAEQPNTSNYNNPSLNPPNMPEALSQVKDSVYIILMQSGALLASDTEYKAYVLIDTYIVEHYSRFEAELNMPLEVVKMYCPLAGKPHIEI